MTCSWFTSSIQSIKMHWSLKDCRHLMTVLRLPPHRKQGNDSLADSSSIYSLCSCLLSIPCTTCDCRAAHNWPAVPAWLARHRTWWIRPGICLQKGKPCRDPSIAGAMSPLGPDECQAYPHLAAEHPRGTPRSTLPLLYNIGCYVTVRQRKVSIQHMWHAMLTSPLLINYNF